MRLSTEPVDIWINRLFEDEGRHQYAPPVREFATDVVRSRPMPTDCHVREGGHPVQRVVAVRNTEYG